MTETVCYSCKWIHVTFEKAADFTYH